MIRNDNHGRVLGSPGKSNPRLNNKTSEAYVKEGDAVDKNSSSFIKIPVDNELVCPICDQITSNLVELNKHIDINHSESSLGTVFPENHTDERITKTRSPSSFLNEEHESAILRKNLKVDLLDDNKSFTLSGTGKAQHSLQANLNPQNKISRAHWESPTLNATCAFNGCNKRLGVKNGIVNCRKCGKLFCDKHTNYKAKLKNSSTGPIFDSSLDSVWCRCCESCYYSKPYFIERKDPKSNDLTSKFKDSRMRYSDTRVLSRDRIQRKFIKYVNYTVEQYVKNEKGIWSNFLRKSVEHLETKMANSDGWQSDKDVAYCTICFTKFSLLIRKHHCRLCGQIVCDDPYGIRKSCSILVPLNKVLEKVANLNYSPLVKANLDHLLKDDSLRFRCCVNCKNDLLFEWKQGKMNESGGKEKEVFNYYDPILILKQQISNLLPKYKIDIDGNNKENLNKIRIRLMDYLKSYESSCDKFKGVFFEREGDVLHVKGEFSEYDRLINNINRSSTLFFQNSLLTYKEYSQILKSLEQKKLMAFTAPPEKVPKLTKKEIRELREQLMVMNEQKFIIENTINEYTKLRKFDELNSLNENKHELSNIIKELEERLGEFGF